ncbi:hypothetical protein PF008_g9315 [Phytophthora fragariae]|uniref:Uncharacterized protein n=1 Tax=Phytophthora fragariae TaxID=53985 RepID=A0A6G0RX44_9STRA|nr:hypothetical protein PF008_g9315 [Phytophthora fragariae]
MMVVAEEPVVNMTDFSRKNYIQAAAKDPTYNDLLEALGNLREFGCSFYNEETVGVLRAVQRFIETFRKGRVPDQDTTRRLVFWVNSKLCQFRGIVLAEGLHAAVRIKDDFSLHDALLSELLYDQQKEKIAALTTKMEASSSSGFQRQPGGRERSPKQTGTPKEVLRNLPKQGGLSLCMKYLTKDGCGGNGVTGKCFSTKRAHFRPATLPGPVKNMDGFAHEYTDL